MLTLPQPFDFRRSWSADICTRRARLTVNGLTQQRLNPARRLCLPHAACHRNMPSSRAIGARNCCSDSSIKARIFRDFSGSGWLWLAAKKFSYFRKPLHFNEKYAYIE
ncbi:hypothetical protein [Mesorhizobium sp. WSM3224]|uniref:hypothetical protein n=1 Tax=Mesorhizobium sp. WSM3224 TaxID=1040986 RepID=UPI0012EB415F|nr:hypothetical protein [Mesorhizobium sp. WSM3224]